MRRPHERDTAHPSDRRRVPALDSRPATWPVRARGRDLGTKLCGYAKLPSIAHYVVVDPDERTVLHYRREGGLLVPIEELRGGSLRLEPPGLEIPVAELFLPPDDTPAPTA